VGVYLVGYVFGIHAPGIASGNPALAIAATHHVLLAHGAAVPIIRANAPGAQVGIALSLVHVEPASSSPEDAAAVARYDGYSNRWYLDPLFRAEYPPDMVAQYGEFLPEVRPGDLAQMAAPLDFLGVNYYQRAPSSPTTRTQMGLQVSQLRGDLERTASDWEVYPYGLYATLKRLHVDYAPRRFTSPRTARPSPTSSRPTARSTTTAASPISTRIFRPAQRRARRRRPAHGLFRLEPDGQLRVGGRFRQRFGVYYLDFPTQRRILKDSGRFLARIAAGVNQPAG